MNTTGRKSFSVSAIGILLFLAFVLVGYFNSPGRVSAQGEPRSDSPSTSPLADKSIFPTMRDQRILGEWLENTKGYSVWLYPDGNEIEALSQEIATQSPEAQAMQERLDRLSEKMAEAARAVGAECTGWRGADWRDQWSGLKLHDFRINEINKI